MPSTSQGALCTKGGWSLLACLRIKVLKSVSPQQDFHLGLVCFASLGVSHENN